MRVYGCQMDIAWEDKDANFQTVRRLLDAVSPEPGSLVALPEMFSTGFSMNVAGIAETEAEETAADPEGTLRCSHGTATASCSTTLEVAGRARAARTHRDGPGRQT